MRSGTWPASLHTVSFYKFSLHTSVSKFLITGISNRDFFYTMSGYFHSDSFLSVARLVLKRRGTSASCRSSQLQGFCIAAVVSNLAVCFFSRCRNSSHPRTITGSLAVFSELRLTSQYETFAMQVWVCADSSTTFFCPVGMLGDYLKLVSKMPTFCCALARLFTDSDICAKDLLQRSCRWPFAVSHWFCNK